MNITKFRKGRFGIRLEARLKNAALVHAREQLGLSARKVAEQIGISYVQYLAYEGMRAFPSEQRQHQICDFYRNAGVFIFEDDVFPPQLRGNYFKRKYIAEAEVPPENLIALSPCSQRLLPAMRNAVEDRLTAEDFRTDLTDTLSVLSPREADIVRRYYGIGREPETLEEIGKVYSLTRGRTQFIKETAIRRLRHSRKSNVLREYFGEAISDDYLDKSDDTD
ncbi:MAG TPA: sigma factor-like helix-turn-helix DNA-binding protein [Candidatus Nanoarchaeia archaeon]|nr:sigma factor-like helix-turn-helix DNA-binding protein [Candidatus Nanoarchaeia archaeon]